MGQVLQGCCGSRIPDAEEFLANEQPPPPNGYLHDGMRTEALTMQAWRSNFDAGNRYHGHSGVLGGLQMVSVAMDQHGDDSTFHTESTLEDMVGNGGVGAPETLAVYYSYFPARAPGGGLGRPDLLAPSFAP